MFITNPTTDEYRDLRREFAKDFAGRRYQDIPEDVMKRGALLATAKLMQNTEVENMLNGMLWSVYDLGLPELSFVISDRPVVMTNGIGNPGGHLAIPISPRLLFIAFRDAEVKNQIKDMSPWHIQDAINTAIVRSAIDVVWDTDARWLKFIRENMSTDAKDDRNFCSGKKRRR